MASHNPTNGQPISRSESTSVLSRPSDPHEALGLPAGSGLGPAFVQATVVTVLAFVALTVGPHFYEKWFPEAPAEAKAPDTAPEPAKTETPKPADPVATKPPTDATATKPPAGTKPDFLDKIGETGTKPTNPKANPLDKKDDDLFKDIDK